jgi:hypothetical protein
MVPVLPVSDLMITAAAIRTSLMEVEIADGEACPVGNQEGAAEGLLVLAPGSSASSNPPAIIIGGVEIHPGDAFTSPDLIPVENGFDCGGKHWDIAYQVPTGQTEIWAPE